ncbi:bifunctional phosphopantothenoylcysteine decarboxylase/phosphopantothenate--cysteine ligase CoaBC [Leuconostoc suionicum]|uniref:bifunctional phosphopantothenoylcysteine decarboxylase/phosphopantothenate--cysteine ligase CoaBC n=1 Tax=Leuconostoc suionicum TaxID=1511761 RepID=UPI001B8AC589|nr:bifunctional phosphopantothenoylcysteine decarboxylase/phosphopantothenate--cysteine ligase CoaBC [Leuconostoc suionicum]MBS1008321.1 bifunctional phosphopantothenoylcysteine decarboxylase/phosphopantothenate--cysteine ligase CoaBC [Leuconostoc suionicum]
MNDFYRNKNILVIVTGSISAYKSATLVREFIKSGAHVRVGMTAAAQEFITVQTLAVLSKHDVLTDLFRDKKAAVTHIEWAKWADLIFVVPATANIIGKIANGIADDAVTATVMASSAVKVIAPAMNDIMLNNDAVVRNLNLLKSDGWFIIDPEIGFLAEGYESRGRLPEPVAIINQAAIRIQARGGGLKGKKIVITAGGTREALDPVRYLTNRSSGKMGYALAQAAAELGAMVVLITTTKREELYGVREIVVTSTRDMHATVVQEFSDADIFISSAAVSDYRPAAQAENKIKKVGHENLTIELIQNPDILSDIGHIKKAGQIVVGFAAETQNVLASAQKKLSKKNADFLIANDVSDVDSGFDSDNNKVTILSRDKDPEKIELLPKIDIARTILDRVVKTLA